MPGEMPWASFFAATMILLLVPGPSVVYILARGIDQGHRAVVFSAVGLAMGDLVQLLGTVAGLSAVLAVSGNALRAVQYAGAGYLIILGIVRLLSHAVPRLSPADQDRRSPPAPSGSLVLQGFLVLNPKTALFFLAMFPQWVDPAAGRPWVQILALGAVFVGLGLLTNTLYGLLGAGLLRGVAARSRRFRMVSGYVSGGVLIVLGLAAALARHNPPLAGFRGAH